MKLPSLQPLRDNDSLNVGTRERKIGGTVHSVDIYITSNIEFCGTIRLRIYDGRWKANYRIKKGVENTEDFLTLAESLKKSLTFKLLIEALYEHGFEERIGDYPFIKKHTENSLQEDKV